MAESGPWGEEDRLLGQASPGPLRPLPDGPKRTPASVVVELGAADILLRRFGQNPPRILPRG